MDKEVENLYEKYMKEKYDVSPEDKSTFINSIASSEIIVVILKGHLYIENVLYDILSEVLDMKCINADMSFKKKLDLANSLGLLADEVYRPLNKFNGIRNSYMHDINYIFNEKEFDDFLSVFSKEYKQTYNKLEKQKEYIVSEKKDFITRTIMLIYEMWSNLLLLQALSLKNLEFRFRCKQAGILSDYACKGNESEVPILQKIMNEFIKWRDILTSFGVLFHAIKYSFLHPLLHPLKNKW